MTEINWIPDQRGGLTSTQVPGLRLHVVSSHFRHACTRRFGWSIYDQEGNRVAGCNTMRWGRLLPCLAACALYVKTHYPTAWEEAVNG